MDDRGDKSVPVASEKPGPQVMWPPPPPTHTHSWAELLFPKHAVLGYPD